MIIPVCQNWGYNPDSADRMRSNVGAGLPAKTVYQSLHLLLNHRLRRQASSHIWIAGHQLDLRLL